MANETEKSVRLAKRGDVVRIVTPLGGDDPIEEVVRDVSIILHLANGHDVRLGARDNVIVIEDDEVVLTGVEDVET